MESNKTVESYLIKHPEWKDALKKLRTIFLDTEMEETVKWGIPTYTINGKNVAGIGAFKSYCGIWFFNGAFLKDSKNLLINAQEGKTKGLRQMRFSTADEIETTVIKPYLLEAIENQKQGKEIKTQKKPLIIPDILKEALSADAKLSEAFENITTGKQREYAEYISEAKRAETRQSRLEKITPIILEGKGLYDKYK